MTPQDATGATQSDERGAVAPEGQAPHERRSEPGQLFDPTPYVVTVRDPDRYLADELAKERSA